MIKDILLNILVGENIKDTKYEYHKNVKSEDIDIFSDFNNILNKDTIKVHDIYQFIIENVKIKNFSINKISALIASEEIFISGIIPEDKKFKESYIYKKEFPDRYNKNYSQEIKIKEPEQQKLF